MGPCMITGNLGCGGQSRRLRNGVIAFSIVLVAAVLSLELDVGAWWRLVLFVPFMIAANLVYQGLFKT